MDILAELAQAAAKLREADKRRKAQRDLVDDLIRRARAAGHGWADLRRATGFAGRSLQLALRRIDKR